MQLMRSFMGKVDGLVSRTWDLRPCGLSYRPYLVTPRQGRHTVRRRLLRNLLRACPELADPLSSAERT